MIESLVNFPIGVDGSTPIQIVDSGLTKVFLVALSPRKNGNIFLDLEGTFSGDDITPHQALSTKDFTVEQISDLIKKQDIYDGFYFPYIGTKHHNRSIPFVAVSHLGTYKYTLEYLTDIHPWVCGFHNLTKAGQMMYMKWKEVYPNCDIRIITMANI